KTSNREWQKCIAKSPRIHEVINVISRSLNVRAESKSANGLRPVGFRKSEPLLPIEVPASPNHHELFELSVDASGGGAKIGREEDVGGPIATPVLRTVLL